ncbi:hypothetical protein [Streptomyces sp. NPDC088246]|uniref:hypothetical protein n=1 Tax=Streptomyces sp. NPDC088246 TaxID=3365842 RepID=UPI0037F2ED5E
MGSVLTSIVTSSVLAAGTLAPAAVARPGPPDRTGIPRLTDDQGRTLTPARVERRGQGAPR